MPSGPRRRSSRPSAISSPVKTIAHVIVAKYADHCRLDRQAQILARQGIAIGRATLALWTGDGAAEIKPVWRSRNYWARPSCSSTTGHGTR